jgi:NADH-quinone oxidoreductase subunit J
MFTKYIFYLLSILALYSALMVLVSRKQMHSVLYLTLTFFAIAGHYVLLNAQFLAVVHIIVYAGAIMVLFLFTVMLLNLNKARVGEDRGGGGRRNADDRSDRRVQRI